MCIITIDGYLQLMVVLILNLILQLFTEGGIDHLRDQFLNYFTNKVILSACHEEEPVEQLQVTSGSKYFDLSEELLECIQGLPVNKVINLSIFTLCNLIIIIFKVLSFFRTSTKQNAYCIKLQRAPISDAFKFKLKKAIKAGDVIGTECQGRPFVDEVCISLHCIT